MTYIDFTESKIKAYDFGIPIYTRALAQSVAAEFNLSVKDASAAVSVAIKRLLGKKAMPELRFFQKGIYYRAKMTPFGETGINKDKLISDKYIAGSNGYETGLAFLHHIGLTTQIPARRVFATNKATGCIRSDDALEISVCPPKVKINANNKHYLQVLDAIDIIPKAPVDADRPYHLIASYIQKEKLDYGELLSIAGKYYSKSTVFALADIAAERE